MPAADLWVQGGLKSNGNEGCSGGELKGNPVYTDIGSRHEVTD